MFCLSQSSQRRRVFSFQFPLLSAFSFELNCLQQPKTYRIPMPNFTLCVLSFLSSDFCHLSSILPQQALAGWMVTAVDLQVAVETSAIKAPVVQSRIDRLAGLGPVARL